jgi:predicted lipoprotein with Yx(FWY)xxD motif
MRYFRALVVIAVACALSGTALAASNSQAVVKIRSTPLGKILVAGNGRTLYMFAKDTSSQSACNGTCATFWPPLLTTKIPKAGAGVTAGWLGTFHRAAGGIQVTYKTHPLYYFAKDTAAGQTKGEGLAAFGAKWFAVSPQGVKVAPKTATAGGGHY